MDEDRPYRFADRFGHGWLRNGTDGTYTTYPGTSLGELTYEQLDAQRGPLRPVEAMATEDSNRLSQALADAGRKAFSTLLVALNRTAQDLIKTNGSAAALTAGRPGSWEASFLRGSIAWEGENISLTRVDDAALNIALELLTKWTTGPTQVELADGLPGILADAAKLAGGWDKITDRWLKNKPSILRWTSTHRDLSY